MKIALIIERMDLFRGGREISTSQVAEELARRGHEVSIICQSGSYESPTVQVERTARPLVATRGMRTRRFARDVQQRIGQGKYDIAHSMLPIVGVNVYQARSGTVPGRMAASMTRWGPLGPVRAAVGLLNSGMRSTAAAELELVKSGRTLCLAVSEMVAKEFAKHYGLRERVVVVYNAVDAPTVDDATRAHWRQEKRYRMGIGAADVMLLTVAKNFRLKGVAESIEHFARWFYAGAHGRRGQLVIVGAENVENYQRHAGLREVGKWVHFVPPTEDIWPLYAAADACLLLSWYDPCSRVVLEALRWGIPSITTRQNGASEMLKDGAGVVVDSPRDKKGVVAAMEAVADPDKRKAMSAAAMASGAKLTIQRHVDELLEAYKEAPRLR